MQKRRLTFVRQTEISECGLACLAMAASTFGYNTDITSLRRRFKSSSRGMSLRNLIEAADGIGLIGRAVKVPLEKLPLVSLPAILHWDLSHFVVLERVKGNKLLIHDPATTSRWFDIEEVSSHFTGVALELRPADDFEAATYRVTLKLHQLWRKIVGLKRAALQVIALTIVMQIGVLATPYYMQLAIDSALPAMDKDILALLGIAFILVITVNTAASALRGLVLLNAGASVSFGISANVARRLLRLPISWFEKRRVGDVLSRFQSIAPIRQFITEDAIVTGLDGAMAALILAIMFIYSATLTLISLCAVGLYFSIRIGTYRIQQNAKHEEILLSGIEQSSLIESIRGLTTIRLSNKEASRHALWQSKLMDAVNANARYTKWTIVQSSSSSFLTGVEGVVTVWVGVGLIMNGHLTTGMLFAFLAYKIQFVQKSIALVDQIIALKMLDVHLERIGDIALTSPDPSFLQLPSAPRELVGEVSLKRICFRYGPAEPMVLDDAEIHIVPGEHVAITGPSGGGKTTLLKIILGLIDPDSGTVLIDGSPLNEFGRSSYFKQIGAVLQDDSLFAGTLAENISLFDEECDWQRVEDAVRTAALLDDISAMPLGFDTLVGDMGSSLSGGQRQRLLLARALYRRPRLLVMDEGTSHLDSAREAAINAAVADLGITRIIVAHRRETIAAADRVFVLSEGRLTSAEKPWETYGSA